VKLAIDTAAGRRCGRVHRALGRAFGCCLAVACLNGACFAAAAAARTFRVDGISDQNLAHWGGAELNVASFAGGYFPNLFRNVWVRANPTPHIQYARFVVPWDVIGDASGERLHYQLFSAWLEDVKWLGLTPDVAITQAEEPTAANGVTLPRVPSSQAQYEQYISALLSYAASIGEPISTLEAWNEPNNPGLGASGHPSAKAAAEFMNAASTLCAEYQCTPIAGDFLDSEYRWAHHAEGKEGTTGMGVEYEQEYERYLNPKNPPNWGFHPYAAVKYEVTETIEAFKDALPSMGDSIWFTEVGVYECENGKIAGTGTGATEQSAGASYLNKLIDTYFEVSHVFYYELRAPSEEQEAVCPDSADTSLYNYTGEARPTASIIFGGAIPTPAAASSPTTGTSPVTYASITTALSSDLGWSETLGWQMQRLFDDEIAPGRSAVPDG
jgi:hypothetical protein